MLFLQCLALIIGVYCLPALAVRPSLLLSPRDALAIPVVSVLVVMLLQALLQWAGMYHVTAVRAVSVLLAAIALLRVSRTVLVARPRVAWDHYQLLILAISIAIAVYIGVLLLLHGFDRHDEIYSWNMWAIQHTRGIPADLYYTQAPYPQLFPRLLSFCYLLLGDVSYQAAVKTALVVFPTVLLLTLGLANPVRGTRALLLFVVLSLYILLALNLKGRFDEGMPDTLMTTAVLVSVFLLLCYRENVAQRHYLVLSVACSVVALLSKQPALTWGMFSLPAILLIDVVARKIAVRDFLIGCIPLLSGIVWMRTEGSGFEQNNGVLARSLGDRGVWEQVEFALREVFLDEPGVLLLVLFAGFALFRDRRCLAVVALFAVPSIVGWLAVASYDIRAGMPGLMCLCLVIAYSNFARPPLAARSVAASDTGFTRMQLLIPAGLLALVAVLGVKGFHDRKAEFPQYVVGHSELNNLFELFAEDAPVVYSLLHTEPPASVWVASNYLYGSFYQYAHVVRPDYQVSGGYDAVALLAEIGRHRPEFMARSSQLDYGRAGEVLEDVANRLCPELFDKLLDADNPGDVTLYRVNYQRLEAGYCGDL